MPIAQHSIGGHIAASVPDQPPLPEHGKHGPVIVDLDEAIFGLNAMAREVFGIAQSGIGQAAAHWQAEAMSMGMDPMGWMSASAYEASWSAIASTIAVSAVSLPFAAMAIKGGIDEIRHGRAERERLRLEQEHLMARHARAAAEGGIVYSAGATASPCGGGRSDRRGLERALAHKDAARLARTDGELRAANAQIGIGAAAASSGTLMSMNGLSQLLLQPILKCCSKGMSVAAWIAQHAAWSAIVSVFGTIATMVLAPLSAVSALCLGSSFVHRSRLQCREFLRAKGLFMAALSDSDGAGGRPVARTAYGRFLTTKLAKRTTFMLRFRNGSIGFLCGATTYTGGVLAKTALIGAALLGFGFVATNPVILVVFTIAVIIGAIVMAAGSLNFILNLGRAKRHESYMAVRHPQLDRSLSDALDSLSATVGNGRPLRNRWGFRMRASLYRRLVMQESVLQGIVGRAAGVCGKHHAWTDRSGRHRYRDHASSSTARARGKDVIAATGAAGLFLRELFAGNGPGRAWRAAQTHFATRRNSLDAKTLAIELASEPAVLQERLCALARIQCSVVRARIQARLRIGLRGDELPAGPWKTWFAEQGDRLRSDMQLVAKLMDFIQFDQARRAAGPDAVAPVRVDKTLIARFLELQQEMGLCTRSTKAGAKPNSATQYAELADYLLHQAPQAFAMLRGSLLACELDAARASAMPSDPDGASTQ
ncbi:hypothetical protein CURE108131_21500 [Cupriavidus respiraculi]|uniref:Transmembrane protein n=1 Tax=Cupriavidus respiraculi TaxID=195930 RepID=A0ABM8X410_9BURK|nr:hypothetical protein [Cupriavidus respiraculi]CAG9174631.1 hypothetical protein LMG21510_02658 [Cupriavidus respiraculi]